MEPDCGIQTIVSVVSAGTSSGSGVEVGAGVGVGALVALGFGAAVDVGVGFGVGSATGEGFAVGAEVGVVADVPADGAKVGVAAGASVEVASEDDAPALPTIVPEVGSALAEGSVLESPTVTCSSDGEEASGEDSSELSGAGVGVAAEPTMTGDGSSDGKGKADAVADGSSEGSALMCAAARTLSDGSVLGAADCSSKRPSQAEEKQSNSARTNRSARFISELTSISPLQYHLCFKLSSLEEASSSRTIFGVKTISCEQYSDSTCCWEPA